MISAVVHSRPFARIHPFSIKQKGNMKQFKEEDSNEEKMETDNLPISR